MSSRSLLRAATRATANGNILRPGSAASRHVFQKNLVAGNSGVGAPCWSKRCFSGSVQMRSAQPEETFDEFSARYEKEFDTVTDVFELQRNLNNAFAYDLVPSTSVVAAAVRCARRCNDFPTAVRIFEAVKAKVENPSQYEQYLEELKPLREELGIILAEEMYPDLHKQRHWTQW